MSNPLIPLLLHVANLVAMVTPRTRLFGLRAGLYRLGGVEIGRGTHICGGVHFDNPHVRVGSDVWIGGGSRIIASASAPVVIHDNCDLGPDVLLVSGGHEIGDPGRRAGAGTQRPITIGAGSWVGARATVLGGVTVGPGSVIAASSLVRQDVAANCVAAGNPARIIRELA